MYDWVIHFFFLKKNFFILLAGKMSERKNYERAVVRAVGLAVARAVGLAVVRAVARAVVRAVVQAVARAVGLAVAWAAVAQ